jgi:hypothetical protein
VIPDGLVPVLVVVSATLVGALMWRLFKVAMKVVFVVVFLVIVVAIAAWNRPDLVRRAIAAAGGAVSAGSSDTAEGNENGRDGKPR